MAAPLPSLQTLLLRVKDPRIAGRTRHRLFTIVLIAVCAVLCGAKDWQQVETFGHKRRQWLARFLDLSNGIPSHDTYERLFSRLDARVLQRVLLRWLRGVGPLLGVDHIAIDGKTLRASANATAELGPLHLVSAWATQERLTLGQVAVDGKSNEITAIPRVLELLNLRGALVTIDAMGCQKAIAAQIVAGGGDYLLAVKENQPKLLAEIQTRFQEALDTDFANVDHDTHRTEEQKHGRREVRITTILRDVEAMENAAAWTNLHVIGMCYCERTTNGKTSEEVRYFIGSRDTNAACYGKTLRDHWSIENQLHWQLDVTFAEDKNKVQDRTGAENLALVRRLALALLKRHPSKGSMACKQLAAALDVDFLNEILAGASKLGEI